MNNKKICLFFLFFFAFLQVCFFVLWQLHDGSTTSLECTSTLKRNSKVDRNLFYSANLSVILKKDGSGVFNVVGVTEESAPRKFSHSYFFTYKIDKQGRIAGDTKARVAGLDNQIKDDDFRINFLDITFKAKGYARLNKFNNVYIFSMPGMILNACTPL